MDETIRNRTLKGFSLSCDPYSPWTSHMATTSEPLTVGTVCSFTVQKTSDENTFSIGIRENIGKLWTETFIELWGQGGRAYAYTHNSLRAFGVKQRIEIYV